MLLLKRNSLAILCLLFICCQKADLDAEPAEVAETTVQSVAIVGTGLGSMSCPYTVADVMDAALPTDEPVWVIGYVVGTARQSMGNAVFSPETENQSNILLSPDSLCESTDDCIPVELQSEKARSSFSIPTNRAHFRQPLLVKGRPSVYLNRKGLRGVSTGLWLDGFDIASVAPLNWGTIQI